MGVNPGFGIFKEMLDLYNTIHFKKENGELNTSITVVDYTTDVLLRHSWNPNGFIQEVEGIYIYPPEYFCPMDYITGKINITSNTYSIHHYTASWHSKTDDKIVTSFVRGIDRIKELSISSVIASVVTIGCNILFLVFFRWGLNGYFIANIIGSLVQCLYLMICTHIPYYIKPKERYSQEKKEMLAYSKPLIANSIAWWVNNASDRYVVIFFCGIAANGIYSIASKIPSILNIFQTIFNQAWTMSAVKEYDPEDKGSFFTNTYKAYNCLMVIICSLIIAADKMLAKFLYAKDFYTAWKYVPWLTIAIVFGALSGYIGGFFSAVKESKIFAQSTVIGAALNLIMNIIFTPIIGPLGAAIATAISYFIVWLIRYIRSRSLIQLRIRLIRDLLTYVILVAQSLVLLFVNNNVFLYAIQCALVLSIIILYKDDIMLFINKFRSKLSQRR